MKKELLNPFQPVLQACQKFEAVIRDYLITEMDLKPNSCKSTEELLNDYEVLADSESFSLIKSGFGLLPSRHQRLEQCRLLFALIKEHRDLLRLDGEVFPRIVSFREFLDYQIEDFSYLLHHFRRLTEKKSTQSRTYYSVIGTYTESQGLLGAAGKSSLAQKLQKLLLKSYPSERLKRDERALVSNTAFRKAAFEYLKKQTTVISSKNIRTVKDASTDSGLSELGEGGFGKVLKAKYGGEYVAVKRCLNKGSDDAKQFKSFMRELSALTLLKHPNIIRLLGIQSKSKGDNRLILELAAKSLHDYIWENRKNAQDWSLNIRVAAQLFGALAYMMDHDYVHLDVKPANVLLDARNNVKLTDFGLSGPFVEMLANPSYRGTRGYVAPEVYLKSKIKRNSDVYSAAMTLFKLIARSSPFSDKRKKTKEIVKRLGITYKPGLKREHRKKLKGHQFKREENIRELEGKLDSAVIRNELNISSQSRYSSGVLSSIEKVKRQRKDKLRQLKKTQGTSEILLELGIAKAESYNPREVAKIREARKKHEEEIRQENYFGEIPENCLSSYADLIRGCSKFDSSKRWSVYRALEHSQMMARESSAEYSSLISTTDTDDDKSSTDISYSVATLVAVPKESFTLFGRKNGKVHPSKSRVPSLEGGVDDEKTLITPDNETSGADIQAILEHMQQEAVSTMTQ